MPNEEIIVDHAVIANVDRDIVRSAYPNGFRSLIGLALHTYEDTNDTLNEHLYSIDVLDGMNPEIIDGYDELKNLIAVIEQCHPDAAYFRMMEY